MLKSLTLESNKSIIIFKILYPSDWLPTFTTKVFLFNFHLELLVIAVTIENNFESSAVVSLKSEFSLKSKVAVLKLFTISCRFGMSTFFNTLTTFHFPMILL